MDDALPTDLTLEALAEIRGSVCVAAQFHGHHACHRRDGSPLVTADDGDCHIGAALDLWLEGRADRALADMTVDLPDLAEAASRAVTAIAQYLLAVDGYLAGLGMVSDLISARCELDAAHLELALAAAVPSVARQAKDRAAAV